MQYPRRCQHAGVLYTSEIYRLNVCHAHQLSFEIQLNCVPNPSQCVIAKPHGHGKPIRVSSPSSLVPLSTVTYNHQKEKPAVDIQTGHCWAPNGLILLCSAMRQQYHISRRLQHALRRTSKGHHDVVSLVARTSAYSMPAWQPPQELHSLHRCVIGYCHKL